LLSCLSPPPAQAPKQPCLAAATGPRAPTGRETVDKAAAKSPASPKKPKGKSKDRRKEHKEHKEHKERRGKD
jgi:hypothetical protein